MQWRKAAVRPRPKTLPEADRLPLLFIYKKQSSFKTLYSLAKKDKTFNT